MTTKPTIVITAGDLAGINGIIILKALKNNIVKKISPLVYGDRYFLESLKRKYKEEFEDVNLNIIDNFNFKIDLSVLSNPSKLTGKASYSYFEKAINDALDSKIDAIATAPIDKNNLQNAGYKFTGHTSILKKLTSSKKLVMMLYGKKLKVALLTIHSPIKEISSLITKEHFMETVEIIKKEFKDKFNIEEPKIAVLGLNPHAGENSKLGKEEKEVFIPCIKKLKKLGSDIYGPFPSDTFFYSKYKEFDLTLAAYHDQGLIPLKMLHFDDAVNISLGAPIIRTSVDHGTAYDIAKTLIASENSMVEAIKEAYRIACIKNNYKNLLV